MTPKRDREEVRRTEQCSKYSPQFRTAVCVCKAWSLFGKRLLKRLLTYMYVYAQIVTLPIKFSWDYIQKDK